MDPSQFKSDKKEYEKISPTAWGVAYRRTLSDIPYSEEIFEELDTIMKRTRSTEELAALEDVRFAEIAPMFEARYKLTNRLLRKYHAEQILEVAAGFSPRGIEMTGNPSVTYVELDLPGIVNEKRAIVKELVGKSRIPLRSNLHLEEGNALAMDDMNRAASLFEQKPLNVVNEGLLRYLSFDEKAQVADNVRLLLQRFGGAWITPDISLTGSDAVSIEKDPKMRAQNEKVQKMVNVDFSKTRFESEEAAHAFFEDLGFDIERHAFTEMRDELVSPAKLGLSDERTKEIIDGWVVFVMRLKS